MISSIGSTAAGGMTSAVRALEASASRAANPARSLETVARDVVGERVATTTYSANAAVLHTADETVGSMLDLVG